MVREQLHSSITEPEWTYVHGWAADETGILFSSIWIETARLFYQLDVYKSPMLAWYLQEKT